ncbi:STAS domain-containing protein [Streptomyces sp. NPDC002082]|uniref:STAS domain-containing protein n=1 Tax=Streptomyces sp. NPDC002082 TaxID=3154772 RepID=UPI003316CA67
MGNAQDRIPPVEVEKLEQQVNVHVGGEMDIDRAPLLYEVLRTLITQPGCPPDVVLGLTDLGFCGSSGLNAILQARLTRPAHRYRRALRAVEMTLSWPFVRARALDDSGRS